MNANELAEAMEIRASIRRQATSRKSVQENANDRLADQLEQAATMLRSQSETIASLQESNRQQQAEIEALKKEAALQRLSDFTQEVEKTLTNEEIYEVWKKAMQEEAKIEYSIYATQLERQPFIYFARAILRKAQEK